MKECNYFDEYSGVPTQIFGGVPRQVDISFVIPAYKRYDLLEKAIKSIIEQKKTEHLTYNIIVLSNDPEFDIHKLKSTLDENIVSVFRNNENIGMVGNMNRIATLSTGRYTSYLQDDDILQDDYLVTIEKTILVDQLEFDCLIPNRYYLFSTQKNFSFGSKAEKSQKIKSLINKLFFIKRKRGKYLRVNKDECSRIWYNCFSGGPTCGIVFKTSALLGTSGFCTKYPYAFDFVFMIDFADRYKTYILNKYLSIYRMTDSASNSAKVQIDCFYADEFLINRTESTIPFVKKFKNEILYFSIHTKSKETQKYLIDSGLEPRINKLRYLVFRFFRLIKIFSSGFYFRRALPNKYKKRGSI